MPVGIAKNPQEKSRKISEKLKGNKNGAGNKGNIGNIPWNKGKKFPQLSGKNNPNWKGGLIYKKCIICGKEFSGRYRNNSKYCSQKCCGKGNVGTKQSKETIEKRVSKFRGEKHFNFQGWKSKEMYTVKWTDTLKISIRERDKYRCVLCGEKQGERTFDVHHIDYRKENCDPMNLVTLCKSCHMKTNYNREHWLNYFKNYLACGTAAQVVEILVWA